MQLFEQRNASYHIIGEDQLQEDKDKAVSDGLVVPGMRGDWTAQALLDTRIKDTTITPFDSAYYCQTLHNPLKVGENNAELITVQCVDTNVKPIGMDYTLEPDLFLSCRKEDH